LRERAPSHNWLPPYLLLEAELYGEAGRHEDQLQLLDEVHCLMREQGQPVGEAEVYRLRASALRARGAAAEDIDDCYGLLAIFPITEEAGEKRAANRALAAACAAVHRALAEAMPAGEPPVRMVVALHCGR